MNVWWCLQWDSVVYTATPQQPPHDGPPPPRGRGGPACRGQGRGPGNSKIFFIHWRAQTLRSMDEHSNIAQTPVNNANIGSWYGFRADWELSCFSCHRYHHWRTYWLTLELIASPHELNDSKYGTQPLGHVHCMRPYCTATWPTHARTLSIGYADRRERRFCLLDIIPWCCRPKQCIHLAIYCGWVSRAMNVNT
jgi:hypothetical protein